MPFSEGSGKSGKKKSDGEIMDQDFIKKIRKKKTRALLVLIVLAAAAVIAVLAARKNTKQGKAITVSLEIRCDELAEDMSKLKDGQLADYIPEDGCIFADADVEARSGETVFDVLDRICRENDIQIEYSYTPGYDSYYVEGINYLYEFDAGKLSGWSYTVNGESPQVGCSQYELEGNEKIRWEYICSYQSQVGGKE